MRTAENAFEILQKLVGAIDPSIVDALRKITRVREEVENALDDERIVLKQWRVLMEELALVHGRALAAAE